ncbi:glycosyltransferase family 2 protein [Nocardioides astragali]|uniref:Glycosyltransferase family 2 protein n=1 Tax=Nocardioides astragali TaxID=1776736 RepID=A0ABW2N7E9_9ACTN|nr:glycosyltransferase family 2 protein [Nocardioides astragali]
MTGSPRVSIGLPVYNGENYLVKALDALLSQTFTDFELIISDNASTDATESICRMYASQDDRIRYVRQARNTGGTPNQNLVVELARGELFKLAAHDDLYGRRLLERCVKMLDEHSDAVLCHADMAYIDAEGAIIARYDYTMPTSSPSASTRFRSLLFTEGGDDEYGVVRTDVLRRVRPLGSFYNPGRPYVAELSLHGRFLQVPELLYYRRDHPDRGDRSPTVQALCSRLDPDRAGQSTFHLFGEYVAAYVRAIHRAPLSVADRAACYRAVLEWLAARGVASALRAASAGGRREWKMPSSVVAAPPPDRAA